MAQFRKKPVVINALQWDGENMYPMMEFSDGSDDFGFQDHKKTMTIDTLEGTMTAEKGDWIIQGVQGEFYPCKPDIFEATYEAV